MSNRRSHLVRQSAPYMVSSLISGNLIVTPDWAQFPPYDDEDGGGPGFPTRMALASDVEQFLNGGEFHERSCNHPDFDRSQAPKEPTHQELEFEIDNLRWLLVEIDKVVSAAGLQLSFQPRLDRALGYE